MFASVVRGRVRRTGTSGAGRGARLLVAVAGSAIALSSMVVADVAGTVDASASGVVSLTPARLLETRVGASTVDGVQQGLGRRGAGSTVEVAVAGRGGVPANAAAVMLNVTAVSPGAGGFVTVFPCGEPRPNASNLNYAAGDVVANAVLSKVGAGGRVCVFTSADADIIVDVNGAFTDGSGVVSLTPARLLETRVGASTVDGVQQGLGRRGAGSTVEVAVAGRGGVPANAAAVMLNVTAVSPGAGGFVTVFPCGEPRPNASNLNYAAGDVVANAVLSKVGAGGRVCVFTSADADIIVDVNGAFTDGSGVVSLTPARLLETRVGASTVDGVQQGLGRRGAGSTVEVAVAGRGGVPANAAAVMLNVTAVSPGAGGFVTVFPCGEPRPNASNLNYAAGDVVANAVLSKVGAGGRVCVFTSADADIIVDVNGASSGGPSPDSAGPSSGGTGSGGGQSRVHRFADLPADLMPAGAGLYTLTTGSTQRSSTDGLDLVAATSVGLESGVPPIDISDVWAQVGLDEPPRGWTMDGASGDDRLVKQDTAEPILSIDRSGYVSSSMSVAIGRLLLLRVDATNNVTAAGSCSGAVVAHTMVLTAAHCLGWDWYVFVPGLMDDQQPVGLWWARGDRALAEPLYNVHRRSAAATAFDYALVKFDPQFNEGRYLGEQTGAFPILQDASLLPTKLAVGYPVEGSYNRTNGGLCDSVRVATSCRPYFCQSSAGLYQDHVDGGRVMTYGCDDHGGASGGPVFAKVGEVWYIISVNAASMYFVDQNGNVCQTRGCAWIMLNGKGPEFTSARFEAFVQAAVNM
jgi:hypothetical protein